MYFIILLFLLFYYLVILLFLFYFLLKMNQNDVIVLLVCHNTDIINSILSDEKKNNFHILFVGYNPISYELSNHPRIIIARNLPNNIEKEKDLLTFTAWYAIVKNNLYMEYNYICILEYDVQLEDNFESELIKNCKLNTFDLISFMFVHYAFFVDVKENVLDFFFKKKYISYKNLDSIGWFPTTNHCLKRDILIKFVDWYYPDCLDIKRIDPKKISWYHERIFNSFIYEYNYNISHLPLLSHDQLNSHDNMHNLNDISCDLINHYMNNSNCEFLQKLIDNYSLFLKLNNNSESYLCLNSNEYALNNYEKQKMLFNTAKSCNNILLIGDNIAHISFIASLANNNISITCIDAEDNKKYINVLEVYFQKKITFLSSSNQEETASIIYNLLDNSFDFIHISQQYPCSEYLNTYIDNCINKTTLDKLKITIDNYDVYSNEIIEKIKNNNTDCEITNEYVANGSNVTKQIDLKINKKKYCIALLTRGYNNIAMYDMLIKRNKHIQNNLNNKSIDIVIFHEGNIEYNHQIYISNETPELKIKFINISKYAFKKEKENIPFENAYNFDINYRHMCSFWFVDFWNFVKEYDFLLRIDEDCYINFNIDNILLELNNYLFITGKIVEDEKFVTEGLNEFSLNFINNNDNFIFKNLDKKLPYGPYTNVFGLKLLNIRNNNIYNKYMNEVDLTKMIYKKRWGDLPLWGEVIYYIFGSERIKIDKNIKYFHSSHNLQVN
jgi:hypothetical protein